MPDGSLHETVQAGKLPNRRPDSMWAGRSEGGDCAICGAAMQREDMEYELEYIRNGPDPGVDTHHVHIRCFTARIWKDKDPGVSRPAISFTRQA